MKYAACFVHFSLVFSKLELRSFHTAFLCSSFFAGRTRAFCVPLFPLVPLGPFVFLYFPWSHSGLLCSSISPGPTRAFCVPLFSLVPLGPFVFPFFPPGPTRAKQGRERYGSRHMLFLLRQVTNSMYFGTGPGINQVCQIPFAKIVLE